MKTKLNVKIIATLVAFIITVASTATAQSTFLPATAAVTTHEQLLAEQAKLAKEHNSTDDESAFNAAVIVIKNGIGSLTQSQKECLIKCRDKAKSDGKTEIANAIEMVLAKASITVSSTSDAGAGSTACNRVLRSGKLCGVAREGHKLVQGHLLCPHDMCLHCSKGLELHASNGSCPTTVAHNEIQLGPQATAVVVKKVVTPTPAVFTRGSATSVTTTTTVPDSQSVPQGAGHIAQPRKAVKLNNE